MYRQDLKSNNKILLMGRSYVGKTQMRSIIFANFTAKLTDRLGLTNSIYESQNRNLGNLSKLWDWSYLTSLCIITSIAAGILYLRMYKQSYKSSMPNQTTQRHEILQKRQEIHWRTLPKMQAFQYSSTNLIDPSFYSEIALAIAGIWQFICGMLQYINLGRNYTYAWSVIFSQLIQNLEVLEDSLEQLYSSCEADEVLLLANSSDLVIVCYSIKGHKNQHQFGKISRYTKQFQLGCSIAAANIRSMNVINSNYTAIIEEIV